MFEILQLLNRTVRWCRFKQITAFSHISTLIFWLEYNNLSTSLTLPNHLSLSTVQTLTKVRHPHLSNIDKSIIHHGHYEIIMVYLLPWLLSSKQDYTLGTSVVNNYIMLSSYREKNKGPQAGWWWDEYVVFAYKKLASFLRRGQVLH